MKKNILFLLLTFLVSGEVFSQTSIFSKNKKKERMVQAEEKPSKEKAEIKTDKLTKARIDTRDGSIYLGEYISESDEAYTLKIISDDTITIAKTDVKRAKTPQNAIVLHKGKYHSTKGLFLHYSIGFNAGYDGGGFMADAGLGYRLSKNLELMTGLGFIGTNVRVFETQNFWGDYKTFFPSYLGVKYNLTHKSVRVFGMAKAGYSSSPLDAFSDIFGGQSSLDMSGGVYFEPSIGLSFATKRIGQTSISISQVIQRSNFKLNSVDQFNNLVTGSGKIWIRRVGIKLTTTVF